MNKKVIKVFFIVTIILLSIFIIQSEVKADYISDLNSSIKTDTDAAKAAKNMGKNIIGALQVAGVGIAICMLIFISIKYMMAAPSEKAEYKKTLTAFVVGAVLIFAATGILEIVKQIVVNATNQLG